MTPKLLASLWAALPVITEGCEQGDVLAPALFAPHAACCALGSCGSAPIDDLYHVTCPERAPAAFDLVTRSVEELAGVAARRACWGLRCQGLPSLALLCGGQTCCLPARRAI